MSGIEAQLRDIAALTPLTIALVALAGLAVGVAPSSFPLLSVAAGFVAGQTAAPAGSRRYHGLRLATGFVLGIVTVDAVIGALFGLAGFAVIRVLASFLAYAYAALALVMLVMALALWRTIHLAVPALNPATRPVRGMAGAYLLGLPFGLSTCPACTPLILPVVMAAAGTGDPVLGGALMFAFGLARGVPIMAVGYGAGLLKGLRRGRAFMRWVERVGGALLVAAALYFAYQAGVYAGWFDPP